MCPYINLYLPFQRSVCAKMYNTKSKRDLTKKHATDNLICNPRVLPFINTQYLSQRVYSYWPMRSNLKPIVLKTKQNKKRLWHTPFTNILTPQSSGSQLPKIPCYIVVPSLIKLCRFGSIQEVSMFPVNTMIG